MKDLYNSHSKLELIQLLVKLFNLELKDNDPMDLVSEIKVILNEIDATKVNICVLIIAFIKDLYCSYSYYLESMQASG